MNNTENKNDEMLIFMQLFNHAFYGGDYTKANRVAAEMINFKKETNKQHKQKKKKRR